MMASHSLPRSTSPARGRSEPAASTSPNRTGTLSPEAATSEPATPEAPAPPGTTASVGSRSVPASWARRQPAEQRRVRGVARDDDGQIVALCNPYAHWQRVTRWVAVQEIESRRFRYYVQPEGSDERIYVAVDEEGRLELGPEVADLDDCAETFEAFDELDGALG